MIFVKRASDRRYVLVKFQPRRKILVSASRADILGKTSYEVFSKDEADLIKARDD